MPDNDSQHSQSIGDAADAGSFRDVADEAPAMLWVTDPDGYCTFLNRRWFEFTGQKPDEALGLGWLEAVHPDDRPESGRIFLEANAAQKPFSLDYRLRRHDGVYRWAIDAGAPRFGAAGEFLGYVGSVIDIDDRRLAESTLKDNEKRLRRIFDNIDVSIWDEDFSDVAAELRRLRAAGVTDLRAYLGANPDFVGRMAGAVRVRRVNEATLRLFHAKSQSDLVSSLHRIFLPDTMSVFAEELMTIWEGRERMRADAPLQTIDGRRIEVAFTIYFPADDPDLRSVLVNITDITHRKREEERQTLLADASEILATSLDVDTTLRNLAQLCVPRFADWCVINLKGDDGSIVPHTTAHVDPERAHEVHELQLRYPTDPKEMRGVGGVIATGEPQLLPEIPADLIEALAVDDEHLRRIQALDLRSAVTVPILAPAGVLGAISLVSSSHALRYTEADVPLLQELGRRAGIALQNARLYATTQKAQSDAESANKVKSQFLATMSHELRTPLNAIGGYADLLLEGVRGKLAPDQLDDLERIKRNQQYLLSIINDILNFARLEAGSVRLEPTKVNVRELLVDLEETMRPQIQERELKYRSICDPSLTMHADRERAMQILLNLVSNAVKFTEPGGSITVHCAATAGDRVRIDVDDTGIGIPEERLAHIFDPFVQIERGAKRSLEGVGLGLAISRDLARAMGGDLEVSSTVGKGSKFSVLLPC